MIAEVQEKIGEDRELYMAILYEEAFPAVAGFVKKMNGNYDDAKDIFHDALVVYYEKLMDNKLNVEVSRTAYVLGIAKHLWTKKYKADCQKLTLDFLERDISIPEDYYKESADHTLLQLLERAGRKCLEILTAFYYEKQPVQKIASTFGYSTVRSATVQKFKCLEKIRNKVKENAIRYEDFAE